MNKEDRKFIRGLINGLKTNIGKRITGLEVNVGKRITGLETSVGKRITGLDQKITGLEASVDNKITGLDQKIMAMGTDLKKQIRHNGILIEQMQDDIGQMKEGFSVFGKDMAQAKGDIAEIKEIIYDYPVLRQTVKKHSRQLAEIRK